MKKTSFNITGKLCMLLMICFLNTLNAQIEKGIYAITLHSFSPTGIKIDGLPLTIFPQTTGLGFSFGTHKSKINGQTTDYREKVLTFGISLNGQYFVMDNFSIGITGSYYSGVTKYTEAESPSGKYATTMMMGGLELRYYLEGGNRLKYWLKASPALGTITSTFDDKEVHVPKRLYQFTGGAGLSYFVSQSFTLDAGITYNVFTIRNKGNYNENSRKEYIDNVGMDLGFTFFF